MRDFVRQTLMQQNDVMWYYERMRARYVPYSTTPAFEPTAAGSDLGNKLTEDMPAPPSMSVGNIESLVDEHLAKNGIILGKTRRARMIGKFKALVSEWFIEFTELYFPEDTNHLISSYVESFRRALALGEILIQSDVWYAGLVEQMEGAEWTKSTTKDHAVAAAKAEIDTLIPTFLDEARGFAEA
jgi:hypothetical protein